MEEKRSNAVPVLVAALMSLPCLYVGSYFGFSKVFERDRFYTQRHFYAQQHIIGHDPLRALGYRHEHSRSPGNMVSPNCANCTYRFIRSIALAHFYRWVANGMFLSVFRHRG